MIRKTERKQKVKPSPSPRPRTGQPDNQNPSGLLSLLEDLARNEDLAPMARTTAARAVLEAKGVLGKHSQAPGTGTAHVPLSEASRPELELELARLRQRFNALPSPDTQANTTR